MNYTGRDALIVQERVDCGYLYEENVKRSGLLIRIPFIAIQYIKMKPVQYIYTCISSSHIKPHYTESFQQAPFRVVDNARKLKAVILI